MQDAAGEALRTRRCKYYICNQNRCGRRTTDELLLCCRCVCPSLGGRPGAAWVSPRFRNGAYEGKGSLYLGSAHGSSGHTARRPIHGERITALFWPILLLCWLGCEAEDVASVVLVRVGSRCRGRGSVRQGKSGSCARTSLATFELPQLLRHDFLSHSSPRIILYRRHHG